MNSSSRSLAACCLQLLDALRERNASAAAQIHIFMSDIYFNSNSRGSTLKYYTIGGSPEFVKMKIRFFEMHGPDSDSA